MATAAKTTTYPHIETTAGVRGGKPCIAGTRIAVVDIVLAHQQGLKPEELVDHFSSRPLALAEIHAALAYHYDHPEELEQHLRDSERAVQEAEAAQAEYLRRKAGR
jgi:uncharacterized protein (DUF433 family)